ncbi:beta-lactamase family protein [bacterium]|nr:beta-lactamase family protein [bacterium]
MSLNERLDQLAHEADIPGAAFAAVGREGLLWHHEFGLAGETADCKPTIDTQFALASFSKVFAGVVILQLVEKGLLSLDSSASELLGRSLEDPELTSDPITIRHLLTHTSGLAVDEEGYLVQRLPAGIHYEYTNEGFSLLAEIIERVEGNPYQQIVRDRVFLPAGMERSLVLAPEVAPPKECAVAIGFDRSGRPLESPVERLPLGAGRAYSTSSDLSAFLQCFLNGGGAILSAASSESMTVPQSGGLDTPRLLVWEPLLDQKRRLVGYHHAGSSDGIGVDVLVYPKKQLGIIVLTNTMFHPSFQHAARNAIYEAFAGDSHPVPPAPRWLSPDEAEGHYQRDDRKIRVFQHDDVLLVQLPGRAPQRLAAVSAVEFTPMPIHPGSQLETALARASGSIMEFIRFDGEVTGLVWEDEYYERE